MGSSAALRRGGFLTFMYGLSCGLLLCSFRSIFRKSCGLLYTWRSVRPMVSCSGRCMRRHRLFCSGWAFMGWFPGSLRVCPLIWYMVSAIFSAAFWSFRWSLPCSLRKDIKVHKDTDEWSRGEIPRFFVGYEMKISCWIKAVRPAGKLFNVLEAKILQKC